MIPNLKLGYSALGGKIYLYRPTKSPHIMGEKIDFEKEVMGVITEKMMADAPNGASLDYLFGEKKYKLTITPVN